MCASWGASTTNSVDHGQAGLGAATARTPKRGQMSQAPSLSGAHAAMLASEPIREGAVIRTGDVDYDLDGTALRGYLALDAASTERRPGVLVIHDWAGVGEYVPVSYTHLRAHETDSYLVCRLLLEKKKK